MSKLKLLEHQLKLGKDAIQQQSSNRYHHQLVLTTKGKVYSWGNNIYGQCGLGHKKENVENPTRISHFEKLLEKDEHIIQICSSYFFSLALSNQSNIFCWGRKNHLQYGKESDIEDIVYPMKKTFFLGQHSSVAMIDAGRVHFIALTLNGHVYEYKNIGQEVSPNLIEFKLLKDTEVIVQVSAGETHYLALSNLGNVYSWGANRMGQCGNAPMLSYKDIATVITFDHCLSKNEQITHIQADHKYSLALSNKSQIYGWGFYITSIVRSKTPKRVVFPLHFLCFEHFYEHATILMNNENVDIQDNMGRTVLILAISLGLLDFVQLCLDNDASLECKTFEGHTALSTAFTFKKYPIALVLLRHHSSIKSLHILINSQSLLHILISGL